MECIYSMFNVYINNAWIADCIQKKPTKPKNLKLLIDVQKISSTNDLMNTYLPFDFRLIDDF